MTTFYDVQIGDKVTLSVTGIVRDKTGSNMILLDGIGWWPVSDETTIEVQERDMPTEPGIYIAADDRALATPPMYSLDPLGQWTIYRESGVVTGDVALADAQTANRDRGGLIPMRAGA